jgi:hypothetical protein
MLSPTSDGAMVEMDYYPGAATLRAETALKARDDKWQLDPEEPESGVEFGFSGSGNSWNGVCHRRMYALASGRLWNWATMTQPALFPVPDHAERNRIAHAPIMVRFIRLR